MEKNETKKLYVASERFTWEGKEIYRVLGVCPTEDSAQTILFEIGFPAQFGDALVYPKKCGQLMEESNYKFTVEPLILSHQPLIDGTEVFLTRHSMKEMHPKAWKEWSERMFEEIDDQGKRMKNELKK